MNSSILLCQNKRLILMVLILCSSIGLAQKTNVAKVHSHNDYLNSIPFWDAYSAGANSIEVDVFFKNKILYATHGERDIIFNRTFENLYLEPLRKAYNLNLGKNQKLILLIDIKSEAYTTLDVIIDVLNEYPSIIHNENIRIIISGNRPDISHYKDYPNFISFDYQSIDFNLTKDQLNKIGLVSLNFRKYGKWDGKTKWSNVENAEILKIIDKAHSYNKEFRFWGIPDTELSWSLFSSIGVDYINTDRAFQCVNFLKGAKS